MRQPIWHTLFQSYGRVFSLQNTYRQKVHESQINLMVFLVLFGARTSKYKIRGCSGVCASVGVVAPDP